MLAALINVSQLVETFGYPLLFLLVMAESSGVPIPGETALITAAVLAAQGKLHIELVIPLAARGGDRGRQHRLPDRAQGRALAAGATRALPAPAPAGARDWASRSSSATVPRRCSSAASSSACASGPRGWPAPRACAGARSCFWNALGGICWATGDRPDRLLPRNRREQRDRGVRHIRAGRGGARRIGARVVYKRHQRRMQETMKHPADVEEPQPVETHRRRPPRRHRPTRHVQAPMHLRRRQVRSAP